MCACVYIWIHRYVYIWICASVCMCIYRHRVRYGRIPTRLLHALLWGRFYKKNQRSKDCTKTPNIPASHIQLTAYTTSEAKSILPCLKNEFLTLSPSTALLSSDSCLSIGDPCSSCWKPKKSFLYARYSEISPTLVLLWVFPHLLYWVLSRRLAHVLRLGKFSCDSFTYHVLLSISSLLSFLIGPSDWASKFSHLSSPVFFLFILLSGWFFSSPNLSIKSYLL